MVAKLETNVSYILDAGYSAEEARRTAREQGISKVFWLSQRDSRLGWIGERHRPPPPRLASARRTWQAAEPVLLPGFAADVIPVHQQDITQAKTLTQALLDGADCEKLLLREPYAERLDGRFDLLSSTFDEGDPQEIVKIEFDAIHDGKIIAENLWVKLSWLSYAEHDASLRFRFSFGMENYEDVAADPKRQVCAAALTEAIFPESTIISANSRLQNFLRSLVQTDNLVYVERIVYFNAPEGGAQFHHDVERGHLGVVFAQLSGSSAWLALSTEQLLNALQEFLGHHGVESAMGKSIKSHKAQRKLIKLAENRAALTNYLNNRNNDPLERLINRTPHFTRHLIDRGHAYILHAGDILLLPQHDIAHCCWHAVYSLDKGPEEALSFAIRYPAAT